MGKEKEKARLKAIGMGANIGRPHKQMVVGRSCEGSGSLDA